MPPDTAATIQAISAAVTTGVTIALAVITHRYVTLTRKLSETAAAQLAHTVSTESRAVARDAATLAQLSESLLTRVRELPKDSGTPQASVRIRSASLWTAEELADLVRLAGRVGEAESANAAGLIAPLGWLADKARAVKAESAGSGFAYSAIDWDRWKRDYTECHQLLGGLFTLAGIARGQAIAALGKTVGEPEA